MEDRKEYRKTGAVAVLTILLLLASAALTLAFQSYQQKTDNIVSFGSVKVRIEEFTLDADGTEQPIQTDETTDLLQGAGHDRAVRIQNVGTVPAFIRLKLRVDGFDPQGGQVDVLPLVRQTVDAEGWICKNGWYYYQKILEPNMKSEMILTKLEFDIDRITAEQKKTNFQLSFEVQAVQSGHNTGSAQEAAGWPKGD